jgi:hypothetical protein
VEFLESRLSWDSDDNTIPEGGNMVQYITALRQGAALAGFEVEIQQKLDKYLSDAGFVDIQVEIKKLPLCPWPRDPKKKVSSSISEFVHKQNRKPELEEAHISYRSWVAGA